MRRDSITNRQIRNGTGYYVIEGGTRRDYSFETIARLTLNPDTQGQRRALRRVLRIVTSMPPRARPVGQVLFLSPFTRQPISTKNLINVKTNRQREAVRTISRHWRGMA
jgi:hypothetical protein